MSAKQPAELATCLKSKKKALLLTGALCDELKFDGKSLLDYAAEIAKKLKLPVAATANTCKGLKERGVEGVAKKYAAEVVDFIRWPDWKDPISPQKPELLILLGYNPTVARGLASGVKGAETAVLGNVYIKEANYSLGDASLKQYQQNLEQLIKAL
jgi:CO dehydrogenase/acetyl-CoA synthase epsilon subunit